MNRQQQQQQLPGWVRSWQLLGFFLMLLTFVVRLEWFGWTAFILIVSNYLYQIYLDADSGNLKAFKLKSLYLMLALVIGVIAQYYCNLPA